MFTAHAGFTQPRSLIARRRKPSGLLSANLLFNKANMKKKKGISHPPLVLKFTVVRKARAPQSRGVSRRHLQGSAFIAAWKNPVRGDYLRTDLDCLAQLWLSS